MDKEKEKGNWNSAQKRTSGAHVHIWVFKMFVAGGVRGNSIQADWAVDLQSVSLGTHLLAFHHDDTLDVCRALPFAPTLHPWRAFHRQPRRYCVPVFGEGDC